ncbi:MAG: hypothetical protein K2O04_02035 [Clostridiales bacterium]|nr:hypothetical protein [Clostridiales bacterium]
MKLARFFKTIVISFCLAACFAMAGLAMTGCGEKKPDKQEEIDNALNAAITFLRNAKEGRNYSDVSKYSDGRVYKYYTESGKIKIEYNETTYAVIENGRIYKIYQTDDLTWHKNSNASDIGDPEVLLSNLIMKIGVLPWSEYDSKTKTLKCVLTDGSITAKLDAGVLIINLIEDTGATTAITIKDVGSTTVTLPEDIVDDTIKE